LAKTDHLIAAQRAAEPSSTTPAQDSLNRGVTRVTRVQASNGAALGRYANAEGGVTGVTLPPKEPGFCVVEDWVEAGGRKYRPGVWYFALPRKADEQMKGAAALAATWVCSPLYVEAVTHDAEQHNFGRLLRLRNTVGQWREWAMPMELLRGAGDELRGELLAMGVHIDPSKRKLLSRYLQDRTPSRRVLCVLSLGWAGDSYVLPDAVIGASAGDVIYQSGERWHGEHARVGTLDGWRAEVAARAAGNPLLVLALSAAFAGPLLARCNAEGGGLHFVGDSSTGKTTLLEAACSVWGGPGLRRTWRATANGMEGAAALSNDGLLALDEISEALPQEVGAIVYALANGRGKQRASRSGAARAVARWRCMVLSSGERTLATALAEGGTRLKAGQSVRLLDVPASQRYGVWDDLHGLPSGAALSDALKRAAATHYGHAGRAYLERLTRDPRDFAALLEQVKARCRPSLPAATDRTSAPRHASRCWRWPANWPPSTGSPTGRRARQSTRLPSRCAPGARCAAAPATTSNGRSSSG
jgi:putative DNA primase/helicase